MAARTSKERWTAFVDLVIACLCNHEPEEHAGAVRQDLVNH
jgi:hypothetical protein